MKGAFASSTFKVVKKKDRGMNRRFWLLSILSLMLVLLVSCRNSAFESWWAEQAISIDGEDTDWDAVPVHRLESWNASVRACNDSGYFYMLLSFEDPVLAMEAGKGGIVLHFARQGGEETIFKLQYAGADTLGSALEPRDSFWDCLSSSQKMRFLKREVLRKNMIAVTTAGNSIRIPSNGTQGISVARAYRQGLCGYEWKIPIQKGEQKPYALGVDLGQSIEIEIHLGIQPSGHPSGPMGPVQDLGRGRPMGRFRGSFPGKAARQQQEVRFRVKLAHDYHE